MRLYRTSLRSCFFFETFPKAYQSPKTYGRIKLMVIEKLLRKIIKISGWNIISRLDIEYRSLLFAFIDNVKPSTKPDKKVIELCLSLASWPKILGKLTSTKPDKKEGDWIGWIPRDSPHPMSAAHPAPKTSTQIQLWSHLSEFFTPLGASTVLISKIGLVFYRLLANSSSTPLLST